MATNGRGTTLDWFAQDTWKVSRRLTLDYGMRFTWYTPYNDIHGQAASFVPQLYNPAQAPRLYYPAFNASHQRVGYDPTSGTYVPAVLIGAIVPGSGSTANGMIVDNAAGVPNGLMARQGVLYAPRIGFAYDATGDGKTAIRGGFGITYNARERVLLLDVAKDPPIQYNPTIYYSTLSSSLQNGAYVSPLSTAGLDPTGKVPAFIASVLVCSGISVGILCLMQLMSVPWAGTYCRSEISIRCRTVQDFSLRVSILPPAKRCRTRFWSLTGAIQVSNSTSSLVHPTTISMQLQLNRRFSHGLQFGAAWTWSKSMDFVSNDFAAVADIVPIRTWNYGLSDFDRTHIAQINWLWDIPKATRLVKNRVVGAIADNWQLSGIASFISGAPTGITLTTTNGLDITGGGDGVRVNILGNPTLPSGQRNVTEFFNPAVFGLPALGTPGDAGRVVFRGPGINNFDMSIFKNIPIKERARFQVRFEAYNAFNHTQFSGVNTTAQFNPATGAQVNAALGTITSARSPRVGQASLRFSF